MSHVRKGYDQHGSFQVSNIFNMERNYQIKMTRKLRSLQKGLRILNENQCLETHTKIIRLFCS